MTNLQIATSGEGFGLSDEEWLLKQTTRELVEREISPRFKENFSEETADKFYKEAMRKLGEAGLLRVWVPEELGGYGQRLTAMLLVTEEVSRGCGALGIHVLENPLMGVRLSKAAPEEWAKIGEKVLDGEYILAAASCDPAGQSNYAEQAPLGRLEGDEWVLNGEKAFSSGGTFADCLWVRGLVGDEQYAWLLYPDTPGLTIHHNPEVGNSPTYASLTLDNVRIPKSFGAPTGGVKGRVHQPGPAATKSFDVGVAAMALGAAGAAFDKTVEYLSNRTSFFKPIASYGGVQYKLVDMKTKLEAAHALMFTAARMIECNHKDAHLYADMAKSYCCDVSRWITSECVQMHGCVGINPDSGIIRHMLDATGYAIGVGTSEIHNNSAAVYMGLPKSDNPIVY